MGSLCTSCFGGNKEDDTVERERLLQDPTEIPADRTSLLGDDPTVLQRGEATGSSSYGTMNGSGTKHTSETSAWNRTLEKMASDVIDVSTIESQNNPIEQSEWMERSRVYASKVANSRVGSILRTVYQPKSVPKNDFKLALDQAFRPVSDEDISLINEFSAAALNAVRQGFVVRTDEQLIVQFDP